jgi:hypothetical protein
MGERRMTARAVAHASFRKSAERGSPLGPMCWADGWAPAPCIYVCDDVTAAIEADRAASEAREAVLVAALAKAANYIESAADIILEDAGGDEDDDRDAREFAAELRALVASPCGSGPVPPGGGG